MWVHSWLTVAIVYLTGAISSLLGPAMFNAFGARATLTYGTLGYWMYVGALYLYQAKIVGGLGVNLAAFCIGATGGPLWIAQNALCIAYPPQNRRGQYFSVFWIIFNLGGVLGGLISVGANWSSAGSSASGLTFALFIAIMMGGSLLATTLVDPTKVVRPDGSSVVVQALPNWKAEAKATLGMFRRREMLLLTPMFAYSNIFYGYQFGVFNGGLFNARTQGLNNTFCETSSPFLQ
eukprot:SAG11_NODE_5523_length_1536_cov_1.781489_1_plen_235_part_00